MNRIKVLIADDHKLVREGIEAMLSGVQDIEVVGTVSSGEDAINVARVEKPDVVLMDIVMHGMTGIEATRWIKANDDQIRVIAVTMEITRDYVTAAMRANVDGYLPKDIGKDTLLEAIRSVYQGETYFNDAIKKLVLEDLYSTGKRSDPKRILPNQLTKRENEVLALVAEGRANKDIAEALGIRVKTVETHKTHILIKLGLNNNSELIRYAAKNKIIDI